MNLMNFFLYLNFLKAHLEEANSTLEAAHRLSEQLDRKEEQLMALKEEGKDSHYVSILLF